MRPIVPVLALFGLLTGVAVVVLHGWSAAALGPVSEPDSTVPVNPYLDRQTLLADPAARLRMPSAEQLRRVGAERHTTPEGYAPAFAGAIFGASATPDDVRAFYDDALRREGWQADTYDVYPTSTDLKVWGWCKPERLFRVAILDPTSFSGSLSQGRSYQTLFHATVNGRTRGVPCPSAR